ncbi:MAG TPA: cytochrome c oxidase subunit 3 [Terracidiphilus sp.]|nr:cytochrome c oxidase subunit 3 [Terracidiphilus sp.]
MSDSTTVANGEMADAPDARVETHAAHPPYQRHHFESVAQQFDATNFAMWLFLLTEIMFFGGLFTAYLIMRNWYYPAFVEGSHHLSIFWGTSNTAVLITSSFTMAMGVWCAQMRRKGGLVLCLSLTLFLGFVFLCIKGIEWHGEWVDQHVPGLRFTDVDFLHPSMDAEVYKEYQDAPLAPGMAQKTEQYFFLYFAMTGMHALHMVVGISILIFMLFRAIQGAYTEGHFTYVENFGLYWHFVDIIWIFLFPLLYLVSRHAK